MRQRAIVASSTCLFVVGLLACEHPDSPTGALAPPPDIAAYVTGEAATALTSESIFPYAGPVVDRGERIISPEQAREQALAYAVASRQFMKPAWERIAERRLDVEHLDADPRVFFAESPYGRFPEGPYHPSHRKAWGPYYLVVLRNGVEAVVLVAVSAYNTDVSVDERGFLWTPPIGGGAFLSVGISADTTEFPFSLPERAVARVSARTGARVAAPPRLWLLDQGHHPALAVWKLSVDRPLSFRVKATGDVISTREVYVNGRSEWMVPAQKQPSGTTQPFIVGPPWERELRRVQTATVPVVPGAAIEWTTVEPSQ